MGKTHEKLDRAIALIKEVAETPFFGKVEITFRAGVPTLVRKEQTFLTDNEGTDPSWEKEKQTIIEGETQNGNKDIRSR